jgi:hypothetical protein
LPKNEKELNIGYGVQTAGTTTAYRDISPGKVHQFSGHTDYYSHQTKVQKIPGYRELPSSTGASTPKSNFVTTDGYVPSYLAPTPIPTIPRSSVRAHQETTYRHQMSGRNS